MEKFLFFFYVQVSFSSFCILQWKPLWLNEYWNAFTKDCYITAIFFLDTWHQVGWNAISKYKKKKVLLHDNRIMLPITHNFICNHSKCSSAINNVYNGMQLYKIDKTNCSVLYTIHFASLKFYIWTN